MELFNKNIFGFHADQFTKGMSSLLNITSFLFEDYKLPFRMNEIQLKTYLHKTNNKVIYTDDSMNNRLTQKKEYHVIAFKRDGEGYYFRIKNDADIEESYPADSFSARLIKQDWLSTIDLTIGEKGLIIQNSGQMRFGVGDYKI